MPHLLRGFLTLLIVLALSPKISAQNFDFKRLSGDVEKYTLIMTLKVEVSFGMQTNEQEQRLLATVVSPEGMVIFDGSSLEFDNPFSSFSSITIKTTPTRIEFTTLDGSETYEGEYIGTDRYTRLGFARIVAEGDRSFDHVSFANDHGLTVGDWVAVYMLLPEFVSPPLAADVGMVSTMITMPEKFPLIVGFGPMEVASVLFDSNLTPVGVLGSLPDPSSGSADAGGFHGFGDMDFPMLGVIDGKRIAELIADPPEKGKTARGWLGITLQALTEDIQEFFNIQTDGGIIVNEVMNNSPADVAGLTVGDIIIDVNGQPVTVDSEEKIPVFQRMISEMGPETPVEFTVIRPEEDGVDTVSLYVTLGEAPLAATDADEYENKELELKVRDLVFTDYMLYNVDAETFAGVVVSKLERGGMAEIGGLQIGDVIQRIGPYEITSVDDAKDALEAILADSPSEVIFFVWRNNKTLFVNVKTE
jgi:serine protease Do